MLFVPSTKAEVFKVTVAVLPVPGRLTNPSVAPVVVLVKITVPVSVCEAPLPVAVTVAVRVTLCPGWLGSSDDDRATVLVSVPLLMMVTGVGVAPSVAGLVTVEPALDVLGLKTLVPR